MSIGGRRMSASAPPPEVANPQVQASYRQMSRQWHEMAERQQTIDEALAERRKPVE